MFRPQDLGNLSLYDFVTTHFRRKRTQLTENAALFLPDHPLFNTHCIDTHTCKVVPVVGGMQMPFVDTESSRETVVQRSQSALVLFKPFRVLTDLVTNPTYSDAWNEAFSQWHPTRTSFICEIMANMDDYSRAVKESKERSETNAAEDTIGGDDSDRDDVMGTLDDVDAALDCSATAREFTVAPPVLRSDDFYHHFIDDDDNDGVDDINKDQASVLPSNLPVFPNAASPVSNSQFQCLLRTLAQITANTVDGLRRQASPTVDFSISELQQFINDTTIDEPELTRSESFRNEQPTEVIALLQNALENDLKWSPPPQPSPHDTPPPSPLKPYASIVEVSQAFTLNQRQHVAFTLIATSLLQRFLRQELGGVQGRNSGYCTDNFEARFTDDQLLLFLGGAGGTGKSRVIDAIDAFCTSWHRDDVVVTTSPTGKAATLIGGRTLASFLMRLKHAINSKHFAPLDLLVIDEVSMLTKTEWLRLDKLLRRYKQVPHVPFGGIHVVLVGDFLQMPPVKADPIFLDPVDKKRKVSTADIEGFELWRKFTTVVILEESVRFRSDPEWGEGCRLARLGQWTPRFIDLINSRVLDRSQIHQHHHLETPAPLERDNHDSAIGANAVFVTPENAARLAVNNAYITETASMLPSYVFPVRALANFKGALNGLSQTDVRYVLSLPDNRFGRMAPYLDLIHGMPVQITQNVATTKGVPNNTLGSLEAVHFPNDTQFRLARDGATSTIVQLPSRSPDYAVLRVPHRPHTAAIRPGLDPDLFPVFYATEAYQKMTITLPKAPDGRTRAITVKPQQRPLRLCRRLHRL